QSSPPAPAASVIHRHAKRAAVVPQEVVVDPKKQSPRRPHPDRALVVADEEDVVRVADPSDEPCAGTVGKRPPVIVRRVALARRTVLTAGPPAHAAGRREVDDLS